jgi:hypothetical protein
MLRSDSREKVNALIVLWVQKCVKLELSGSNPVGTARYITRNRPILESISCCFVTKHLKIISPLPVTRRELHELVCLIEPTIQMLLTALFYTNTPLFLNSELTSLATIRWEISGYIFHRRKLN